MKLHKLLCLAGLILLAVQVKSVIAADDKPVDAKAYGQAVDRAIQYLVSKGQATDGSYSAQAGPGVTALVTAGILRHGRSADDPAVAKSLKYLESFVQPRRRHLWQRHFL